MKEYPEIFQKALQKKGSYALGLRTGEWYRFSKIEEISNGWIKITACPEKSKIWIRYDDISWIMDETPNKKG